MPLFSPVVVVALLTATPAPARFDAQGKSIGEPLSERTASYVIDARLDPEARKLTGHETVTWVNRSAEPQATLWFHAYWNAFKNAKSTFYREAADKEGFRDEKPKPGRYPTRKPDEWGWMQLTRTVLPDGTDLLPSLRWQHPDDDNADDQTVFTLTLPQSVPPGGTITFELSWESRVPRAVARAGYSGDYYLFGQWFPKLAVLEVPPTRGATQARWNAHQYHSNSEFYADFGTYDVSLTLPARFFVGATGVRTGRTQNPDGTVTHRFHQDDVQEFAWTANPKFIEVTDVFREDGLPEVALSALVEPQYRATADQALAALKASLRHYGRWWYPYPYPHVTVVAPPNTEFAMSTGGMEYPTFFTIVSRRDPGAGKDAILWNVTAHEFGHNYWMGLVASNEFEEAWMDEGVNSYGTAKLMDAEGVHWNFADVFGRPLRALLGPLVRSDFSDFGYASQAARTHYDSPIVRDSWKYRTTNDYGENSYPRTELALRQLELTLGPEVFAKVMRTYVQRWAFKHPATADFFAVAREVSGRDLSGFEQQFFHSTLGLDLAVADIACATEPESVAGAFDDAKGNPVTRTWKEPASKDTAPVRCTVTVEQRAPLAIPAIVRVTFEDGSVVDEAWDGKNTWAKYTYVRAGKSGRVREARIDPGGVNLLDAVRVNDARSTRFTPHAPTALAGFFLYVSQLFTSSLAAFL
ncbi:MAG: M1 family metallopeptidase [Myxococcaceae bacterium]